jgi:hypothetical protein
LVTINEKEYGVILEDAGLNLYAELYDQLEGVIEFGYCDPIGDNIIDYIIDYIPRSAKILTICRIPEFRTTADNIEQLNIIDGWELGNIDEMDSTGDLTVMDLTVIDELLMNFPNLVILHLHRLIVNDSKWVAKFLTYINDKNIQLTVDEVEGDASSDFIDTTCLVKSAFKR